MSCVILKKEELTVASTRFELKLQVFCSGPVSILQMFLEEIKYGD